MKTKITIKKDSKAAVAIKAYMAEKEAFRKAVQEGRAIDYVRKNPQQFGQTV
ncbi:hypothetical protein V9K67_26060 [Paraflavisolibacter sp. H34]|uniref:hypothetical protein n=1 Tax=Huijunlia imazamoxiresistens TaxID=3127457 RepID=UPI00301A62DE